MAFKTEDLKMINIKIDEERLLDLLNQRVEHWTDDRDVQILYEEMYENYIQSNRFEGMEIDINVIVDNDYINYCDIICDDDERYEEIAKIYNEQGLGDCSCECDCCDYIESEYNGMFLVRV